MVDKRAMGFLWMAMMLLASALATVSAEDVVCTSGGSECDGLTGTCVDSYACDETTLTCLPIYTADGEGSCSDANGNPSKCDGNGGCKLVDLCAEVTCNTPGNVCLASVGTCDPATGTCSYEPKPAGEACTKNGFEGKCDGAAEPSCDLCADGCEPHPNVCMDAGTCNPENGTCSYAPLPSGTVCLKNGLEGKCDGELEDDHVDDDADDADDDDDDDVPEEEHPKCDLCAGVVCTPKDFGEGCVKAECNPETKQCDKEFKKDGEGCNKGKGDAKQASACLGPPGVCAGSCDCARASSGQLWEQHEAEPVVCGRRPSHCVSLSWMVLPS